jgi:two-component system chemotaxis sensor kinase CheA
MMGFSSIRDLAHHAEDILSAVQKGQTELTKEVTDLLLESLDRIEELLPSADVEDVNADVSDLISKLDNVDCSQAPAKEKKTETPVVEVTEPPLKVIEDKPGSSEEPKEISAVDTKAEPGGIDSKISLVDNENDKSGTEKTKPAEKQKNRQPHAKRSDPTIRVHIERLDKLLNLMGEVLVNQLDTEGQVDGLSSIHTQIRELKTAFGSIIGQVEQLKKESDPDKIAVLDQQIHKADENATAILEQLDHTTSHLKENTTNRRIALDELQDRTLHVRMLPISTIFGLYPRVVRDASGSCGKKVKLVIEGEKTELDKRILEQVSDPLVHIIRNSVDHGIEIPSDRVAADKPDEGVVKISAVQRGDKVEIAVEDDGAGIDPAILKRKAVEKGLIADAEEMSDEEALDLIFKSGFSTAGTVTSISGRGVGLDVVKNNIEKLEGHVELESVPGQGTRFIVSLPVSLAIFAGLLVVSNDSKFVIPLASVQEMVAIDKNEIQTLGNHRGFISRGCATPLVDLLQFLGNEETECEGEKIQAVIVGSGKSKMALQVGSFLGEQEVVIKSLGTFLPRLPNVGGITVLASGEAVIVLNVNELISNVRSGTINGTRAAAPISREEVRERKISVLVVEDSLVVRELQRNILESAGYKVDTAVDGEDALTHLAKERPDCIVTDIEMPRMNGFELTSAVRSSEKTKETPVIMCTSLSNEDDKQRGIEVGANAYVVKGTFDQHNLLSTIERLVA